MHRLTAATDGQPTVGARIVPAPREPTPEERAAHELDAVRERENRVASENQRLYHQNEVLLALTGRANSGLADEAAVLLGRAHRHGVHKLVQVVRAVPTAWLHDERAAADEDDDARP